MHGLLSAMHVPVHAWEPLLLLEVLLEVEVGEGKMRRRQELLVHSFL